MANRINTQIVKDYEKLQKDLPAILKAFGISQAFLYRAMEMPKNTFRNKLKACSFTISEMLVICEILNR